MASNSGTGYNFKVVLLGEGCVGKTSCVMRYMEEKFNSNHVTTLQASFLKKRLNIRGKRVNLAIWDTAGQERFHALGPIYYRDAHGAVLVYDITDSDSFIKVQNWVKELRKMLGAGNISLAIAGNKTDLEGQRNVNADMAIEYAKSVNALHFHTSAKLNRGIEDMFLELSQQMMSRADDRAVLEGSGQRTSPHGRLRHGHGTVVVDDGHNQSPASGGGCCGGSRRNDTLPDEGD